MKRPGALGMAFPRRWSLEVERDLQKGDLLAGGRGRANSHRHKNVGGACGWQSASSFLLRLAAQAGRALGCHPTW